MTRDIRAGWKAFWDGFSGTYQEALGFWLGVTSWAVMCRILELVVFGD